MPCQIERSAVDLVIARVRNHVGGCREREASLRFIGRRTATSGMVNRTGTAQLKSPSQQRTHAACVTHAAAHGQGLNGLNLLDPSFGHHFAVPTSQHFCCSGHDYRHLAICRLSYHSWPYQQGVAAILKQWTSVSGQCLCLCSPALFTTVYSWCVIEAMSSVPYNVACLVFISWLLHEGTAHIVQQQLACAELRRPSGSSESATQCTSPERASGTPLAPIMVCA